MPIIVPILQFYSISEDLLKLSDDPSSVIFEWFNSFHCELWALNVKLTKLILQIGWPFFYFNKTKLSAKFYKKFIFESFWYFEKHVKNEDLAGMHT